MELKRHHEYGPLGAALLLLVAVAAALASCTWDCAVGDCQAGHRCDVVIGLCVPCEVASVEGECAQ